MRVRLSPQEVRVVKAAWKAGAYLPGTTLNEALMSFARVAGATAERFDPAWRFQYEIARAVALAARGT